MLVGCLFLTLQVAATFLERRVLRTRQQYLHARGKPSTMVSARRACRDGHQRSNPTIKKATQQQYKTENLVAPIHYPPDVQFQKNRRQFQVALNFASKNNAKLFETP